MVTRMIFCPLVGLGCWWQVASVGAQEKKAEPRPVPQAKISLQRLQPAVKVNAAAEVGEA
jgi:hypothetical protein